MKARSRWVHVGAVVVGCLFLTVTTACKNQEPAAKTQKPVVALTQSDLDAVRKDRKRLAHKHWEPLSIRSPNGQEWFVPIAFGSNDSRVCWKIVNGARTEIGSFAPAQWQFVNYETAASPSDDSLMVVWSGFDGTPGETIAASFFNGETWSPPDIIARDVRVRCLDVVIDPGGRFHLLYVSPLVPAESYGPFEGFFPAKCWHAINQGGTWNEPVPIQEVGRFDIHKAALTLVPSGHLVASAEMNSQSLPADRKLVIQVFGDDGWSDLKESGKP